MRSYGIQWTLADTGCLELTGNRHPQWRIVSAAERLRDLVDNSCGGCYGIEWRLAKSGRLELKSDYNPQWRIDAVKDQGREGLYTGCSKSFTFAQGEGMVGKAFAEQREIFVEDLQVLSSEDCAEALFKGDHTEFLRADLAKQFGIHSAVFLPSHLGVLEVGSTKTVASVLQLLSCVRVSAQSMQRELAPSPEPASPLLQDLVENSSGCCYGIDWKLAESGRLELKSHYNPKWRIDAVREQGLGGLYTTRSSTYSFAPGEGIVGKAFAEQREIFVEDLQVLSSEDFMEAFFTGDHTEFMRADLAKQFGIHSAAFIPCKTGVLEIGTTSLVASQQDLLPNANMLVLEG